MKVTTIITVNASEKVVPILESDQEFGIRRFSRVLSFKFESSMRIRFMQHLIESIQEFQLGMVLNMQTKLPWFESLVIFKNKDGKKFEQAF